MLFKPQELDNSPCGCWRVSHEKQQRDRHLMWAKLNL